MFGALFTLESLGVFLLSILTLVVLMGVRYVPNDRVGIVEKRWSLGGSIDDGFIALGGKAGFQPRVLRGGLHWLMPIQYRVHRMPLVTIPQGKIGYVFARDGQPLVPTQTLASNASSGDFLDVERFLRQGGQRGPQRAILREGTYALNLAQFVVLTESSVFGLSLNKLDDQDLSRMAQVIHARRGFEPIVIKGTDDLVGIVTVHDGPSLPQGTIIAPVVGDDAEVRAHYHNNFQSPEIFLAAGGMRGRQLQVLVEGTYYINRLFATVEMIPKTVVAVGNVGVVVSYTGDDGQDLSGQEYKHGELVARGSRGVWSMPLLPGKYAFNTYAGHIIMVPTTNFILKWNRSEVGSHRFDENLSEVSLITRDAFEPRLPLSVVVHIDYRKAPLVVQRFGDVKHLVEQTLDPMVAAYFKNIGQTRTLIQLLQDRNAIQEQSGREMKAKFEHYNLELEEVLIGTPSGGEGDRHIDQILAQLRQRQIAEEQVETYARQKRAAGQERELREAEARAEQQKRITASELSIDVQANEGKAEYQRSLQEALRIRAMAEAEAERIRAIAQADADRAARVGIAEAIATEEQVRAYGGPRFQVAEQVMAKFADAIAQAKVDVVPRVLIGGAGSGGQPGGNLIESLLTLLLTERLGEAGQTSVPAEPEVDELRQEVRRKVFGSLNGTPPAPNTSRQGAGPS